MGCHVAESEFCGNITPGPRSQLNISVREKRDLKDLTLYWLFAKRAPMKMHYLRWVLLISKCCNYQCEKTKYISKRTLPMLNRGSLMPGGDRHHFIWAFYDFAGKFH